MVGKDHHQIDIKGSDPDISGGKIEIQLGKSARINHPDGAFIRAGDIGGSRRGDGARRFRNDGLNNDRQDSRLRVAYAACCEFNR